MINYFLKRPVFAFVISIIIVLLGIITFRKLPIEQFPPLAPVEILVRTVLPGASAETMADSVAAPLEQAINGVEDMIYMFSQSSAPGHMDIRVCFKIGTDPNQALINTQTRVNLALSALPLDVQNQGVLVRKQSSTPLLFVAIQSDTGSYDELFLTNFANINISKHLERIPGVSSAWVLNAREYSMRIWLKPDRLAQFGMSTSEVINAVRNQNDTRSIGLLGQEPVSTPNALAVPVTSMGRLKDPSEFENIILRANPEGSMVLLRDVSRVELGGKDYNLIGKLNQQTGAFIGIYQDTGVNALEISKNVKKTLKELSRFFPEGISYSIPYDVTDYIRLSIWEVGKTFIEAAILVSLIILVFLHNFRISLVPIIAMIVSIIGTFSGMYLLNFSINTLTLFGLVLSIGIVVDDAIIVVENIERKIRESNLSAFDAAIATMKEVSKPVIATSCVLIAVFIPASMLGGIAGQFYKQFAITIALSVLLSTLVALTLSPVLSVLLLQKPVTENRFGKKFNQFFNQFTEIYLKGTKWVLERPLFATIFCIGILFLIAGFFKIIPIGLVPKEDQGLILISSDLPDGASLDRVKKVSDEVEKITLNSPGISDILSFSGYSLLESILMTNMGGYFVQLKDLNQRKSKDLHASQIINTLNREFEKITDANVTAFNPPDIPGIGVIGGFDFWISNEGSQDYLALNEVINKIVAKAQQRPEFSKILSSIRADGIELYIDLDRIKAKSLGVSIDKVYETLQVLLGSVYINQFNKFGRVYHVVAQAEPSYRDTIQDIGNVYVKSERNEMIPLKSLIIPKFSTGPTFYQRFNGSPAGLISVIPAISDANKFMKIMEEIADEFLLPQMTYSWGGLGFEQKQTGGVSGLALSGSLILAFLVLAALYERWMLPLSILMATPFAILGSLLAIWFSGGIADIYFLVGIIALIGLSAKNSILVVEFAKEKREQGATLPEAALGAVKLRFRAILMTSLTMIIGALPLLLTSGAGAASRKSVGTGIIGGMAIATFLALFFVPSFYKAMERLSDWFKKGKE